MKHFIDRHDDDDKRRSTSSSSSSNEAHRLSWVIETISRQGPHLSATLRIPKQLTRCWPGRPSKPQPSTLLLSQRWSSSVGVANIGHANELASSPGRPGWWRQQPLGCTAGPEAIINRVLSLDLLAFQSGPETSDTGCRQNNGHLATFLSSSSSPWSSFSSHPLVGPHHGPTTASDSG